MLSARQVPNSMTKCALCGRGMHLEQKIGQCRMSQSYSQLTTVSVQKMGFRSSTLPWTDMRQDMERRGPQRVDSFHIAPKMPLLGLFNDPNRHKYQYKCPYASIIKTTIEFSQLPASTSSHTEGLLEERQCDSAQIHTTDTPQGHLYGRGRFNLPVSRLERNPRSH